MNAPAKPVAAAPLEPELEEIRSLLLDSTELVRAVGAGRRRNAAVAYRRVDLRYVDVRGERRLQITTYDETQAHVRNERPGAAALAVDELIRQPFRTWHVETRTETVQVRVTKRGRLLLHRGARAQVLEPTREHNRSKRRRLSEGDELFEVLGLATPDGRIKASRQSKYRQVEDFLAALDAAVTDDLLDRLSVRPTKESPGRPLRMVDLGCGNAYLSFAAFRYLTTVRGIDVRVVGIDVKATARSRNEDIAKRLGMAPWVRFLDSTISEVRVDENPDVVLALHACDTATDDALARAVHWRASVILAAPCCHHDVQRQLSEEPAPEPYQLVTRQPILRERFADVLTDSVRAAILRLVGYRAEVVEFVDPEHTPRNALIRAVRTDAAPPRSFLGAYQQLVSEWRLRPALADRLAAEHPELIAPALAARAPTSGPTSCATSEEKS